MPKISCIMPVYNTAKYLEECIDSILNQTFTDFEFIISDDGSTDESKEIIKKYAEKDNRIIFLDNKINRWIVDNLNDCLDIAKWEYIAIMESDDVSMPERFEKQVDFFRKNPDFWIISTNWFIINEQSIITKTINLPTTYLENMQLVQNLIHPFCTPAIMIRSSILAQYYSKFKNDFFQDIDLSLTLWLSGVKLNNLKDRLIKYRIHSTNGSKTKRFFLWKALFLFRMDLIKRYGLKNKMSLYLKSSILSVGYFLPSFFIKIIHRFNIYEKVIKFF